MVHKVEVRIQQLRKMYGLSHALRGLSYVFGPGEIIGLLGPNGAGKTTTLRIISSLDLPTAGDVYIDKQSVMEEPQEICKSVGFMPDALPSHRDMTVHEYLVFYARAYGLSRRQSIRTVEGLEEFTKLQSMQNKFLGKLSKGMKQRVSLARALVHDPPVLLLDEPAAGLDPRARVEFREILKALSDRGKAMMISSHIISELEEICSGVIIMEKGKKLCSGTIEELMDQHCPLREARLTLVKGDVKTVEKYVKSLPHVERISCQDNKVTIRFEGDEAIGANILNSLIRSGVKISDYDATRASLEDLYMTVTNRAAQ